MKKKPLFKTFTMNKFYLKNANKKDLQAMSSHVIRYMINLTLLFAIIVFMAGCSAIEKKVTVTETQRFDVFLEDMAKNALKSSPLTATFTLGDLQKEGLYDLASQLDHISIEEAEDNIQQNATYLETLKSFDLSALSEQQKLNYALAEFNLTAGDELVHYMYIQNLLQASSGIQVDFPLALMQIEFESKEEIDAFILRVKEFPRLVDETILYEKERFSLGYGLPGYIYTDVAQQIRDMLVEPENFLMMLSFSDRIDRFEGLTEEVKATYKATYLEIVKKELYPAFEKLKDQAVEMEISTASGSISDWSDGKAYYEDLVNYMTSEELDVKELEEWANNEIDTITQQFQDIITNNPSLLESDFQTALPTYNSMEEIYSAINKVYKAEFNDYGITFASENIIPPYLEKNLAAGFYFPITVDGEDYGNMYLQKKDYDQPTADTLMLYYHENIPGHHLYYSYVSKSDQPLYRKMNEYLAYEEGWATYCQNLAFENMGLDKDLAQFFELNSAYSNAFMVLMDIKLHYEGMSISDVKQQFLNIGYDQDSVDSMVDRMISKPGETIHYMYGNDKMNEWKDRFKNAKGSNFDPKEFHDFVLSHFGLPFFVVEKELDRVLNSK